MEISMFLFGFISGIIIFILISTLWPNAVNKITSLLRSYISATKQMSAPLSEICPDNDEECIASVKKKCPDLNKECIESLTQMDYYLVGRENYNNDKK